MVKQDSVTLGEYASEVINEQWFQYGCISRPTADQNKHWIAISNKMNCECRKWLPASLAAATRLLAYVNIWAWYIIIAIIFYEM